MNRAQRKEKKKQEKRLRKEREMKANGGRSRYARKKAWLVLHTRTEIQGGEEVRRQLWGFEVSYPKPWR